MDVAQRFREVIQREIQSWIYKEVDSMSESQISEITRNAIKDKLKVRERINDTLTRSLIGRGNFTCNSRHYFVSLQYADRIISTDSVFVFSDMGYINIYDETQCVETVGENIPVEIRIDYRQFVEGTMENQQDMFIKAWSDAVYKVLSARYPDITNFTFDSYQVKDEQNHDE